MNKFKVGDIITGTDASNDEYSITNSSSICEVIDIGSSENIEVKLLSTSELENKIEIGHTFSVLSKYFMPYKFDLSYIKVGDIITLRNGDRLLVCDNFDLIDIKYTDNHALNLHSDYDDELKSIEYVDSEDIIKVERIKDTEIVYEEIKKSEKVKEMTLKEVCEELGYEIKIIKEKEGNK